MSKKSKSLSDLGGLVYATDVGRIRPPQPEPVPPGGDGIVRLRRETKGRGGKTVISIAGVPLPADELKALAGELKKRCGCGGSFKDGVIEIQGEHLDLLLGELQGRGFKVKKAGG